MLGWARRPNLRAVHAPHACRVRCSPKGPKLGLEYLPAYKTLHYVHGIPILAPPKSENALNGLFCDQKWVKKWIKNVFFQK